MIIANYANYGYYENCIKTGNWTVNVNDITKNTLQSHINSILNIFRDGIETDLVQSIMVSIYFNDDYIRLSLMDYLNNLILWRAILYSGESIQKHHVFFENNITRNSIKNYIDKFLILKNRRIQSNRVLNNIINDTLSTFKFVSEFALYLANTINLEDDIHLMNTNPEANDIYHTSLANVPLEDIKRIGSEKSDRLVEIIKNSDDHSLSNFFKTGEGINPKQWKEYAVNIGTKPDGNGQVYPVPIDGSFIMGGLKDVHSIFIEDSAGRTAQILSKHNVGGSGHFARLLGLNNTDTILYPNPEFVCDTKNFEELIILNDRMLSMLEGRWYRLNPNGVDYCLTKKDRHLIGQKIFLRSPITCASKSDGHGVCYKCYGELAYVNNDINIGKIAAELLSSLLTQRLLSAKHLLESIIVKMEWTEAFYKYFSIDANIISLQEDLNLKGCTMIIDNDNIIPEYELDDFEYNEYVSEFDIQYPNGVIETVRTSNNDNMYISTDLNDMIRSKAIPIDGKIVIDLNKLSDIPLFLVKIHNNELTKTLEDLIAIIDKTDVTKEFDRNSILQKFIETILKGNLDISSIHCEILISNQVRSLSDVLVAPDWSNVDEPYQILTLKKSLSENPSIIVSLNFQELSKTLYKPLTYRRNNTSFLDVFFMSKPQVYLNRNFEGEM